jgi:hypothetical protein
MARLEELQQLWQSQPQPGPAAVDSRGMKAALHRFRRRQNLIYSGKAVLAALLVWFCLSSVGRSPLAVAGAAVFFGGALGLLLADWRGQLAIARLDFTKPSAGFVDSVLERLRDPHAPFRRLLWLHMIPICAGINLMFAAHSIAAHLAATLGPLAGCALGLKIRSKRYAAEYRPIIERLTAMKTALEERPQ